MRSAESLRRAVKILGPEFLRRVVRADIMEEPEAYGSEFLVRHAYQDRLRRALEDLGASPDDIEDPTDVQMLLANEIVDVVDLDAASHELVEADAALEVEGVRIRVSLAVAALLGELEGHGSDCLACGQAGDGPLCRGCVGASPN